MKKLTKLAFVCAVSAFFTVASAQTINNWVATDDVTWKNGTNELCWRNSFWTPATAAVGCDRAIVTPAVEEVTTPKQLPSMSATKPVANSPVLVAEQLNFSTDAFFDFDKAVLKPEGKVKLDDFVSKATKINIDVIIAVGHTDSIGSETYNQKLSEKRAQSVKAYLVSKGIDKNRVSTQGKGEAQPIADNTNSTNRRLNRRVNIEVIGSR